MNNQKECYEDHEQGIFISYTSKEDSYRDTKRKETYWKYRKGEISYKEYARQRDKWRRK